MLKQLWPFANQQEYNRFHKRTKRTPEDGPSKEDSEADTLLSSADEVEATPPPKKRRAINLDPKLRSSSKAPEGTGKTKAQGSRAVRR